MGGTLFTGIMLWAIKVDAGILGGQENGILAWNILYGSAATIAIIYLLKDLYFCKDQLFQSLYRTRHYYGLFHYFALPLSYMVYQL